MYASQYSYGMDGKVHDTRSEYICANQPLMKYDIKYRLDDLHGEVFTHPDRRSKLIKSMHYTEVWADSV